MNVAPAAYLPPELYRPVVEAVTNTRTLVALLCTSRIFNYEAERVLYSNFSNHSSLTQRLFFTRVTECSRVAKLVLSIEVYPHYSVGTDLETSYWMSLSAAFKAMVNLKTLVFHSPASRSMATILRGCTFQLTTIDWVCHEDEQELAQFFETQHTLQQVALTWDGPNRTQIPIMSNIVSLRGDYNVVHAFLPGRDIRRLHWKPDYSDQQPDLSLLTPALSNVKVLMLGGYFLRPKLVHLLPAIVNVEFLELITLRDGDLDVITRLKNLRGLTLTRRYGPSDVGVLQLELCRMVVPPLFHAIPSLCFVHVDVGGRGLWPVYKRWDRQVDPDTGHLKVNKNPTDVTVFGFSWRSKGRRNIVDTFDEEYVSIFNTVVMSAAF